MRLAIVSLALAALVAACSTSPEAEPDRLAILDDGTVVTLNPDGTDPRVIAESGEGPFFQPIWSPDRSLLAFSLGAEAPAIYMARIEDGELFSIDTGSFPFYFSWSPRNELAILHNHTAGLRLDTTTLEDESLSDLQLVETGQPLYYSWSPDGAEVAAHIGIDRLLTSDLAQSSPIEMTPGAFQAPSWTDRGIVALSAGESRQTLTIIESDGTVVPIATVEGAATFVPSHDASLIAVQSAAAADQFQSASLQTTPRLPANRLVVVDVDTGEVTRVTTEPVLAYFWSPVDDQLLVLDIVPGPLARWRVWNDQAMTELTRFTPEPRFVTEFLPFFDQYAQSVSLWSPDASAIAFPGAIEGQTGIWVQQLGSEPQHVHDGSWVSWAP